MDNIFPDDDSENHVAIFGYSIYGVRVYELLQSCESFKGDQLNYRQKYNYNNYMLRDANFKIYVEEIRDYLIETFKIPSRQILSNMLIDNILNPISREHNKSHELITSPKIASQLNIKEEKRLIEEKLII